MKADVLAAEGVEWYGTASALPPLSVQMLLRDMGGGGGSMRCHRGFGPEAVGPL